LQSQIDRNDNDDEFSDQEVDYSQLFDNVLDDLDLEIDYEKQQEIILALKSSKSSPLRQISKK